MILAGLPATITNGGTSLVTTLPAAIIAPLPIFTRLINIELNPIQTSSSIFKC